VSLDWTAVNVWAVLVAAVASFVVGGVWFGGLFAKAWVRLHGFGEEQLRQMQARQARNFTVFFAGDLVTATVFSLLLAGLGVAGVAGGAAVGFLLWLGVAATFGFAKNAATNRPLGVFLIGSSHELACLVVMGLILGAWR
jgi:hypothetical protein